MMAKTKRREEMRRVEDLVYYRTKDLKTYRKLIFLLPTRLLFFGLPYRDWILYRIKELEKTFYFVFQTAEY